jgi:glucose/arabinose dehydrogenase
MRVGAWAIWRVAGLLALAALPACASDAATPSATFATPPPASTTAATTPSPTSADAESTTTNPAAASTDVPATAAPAPAGAPAASLPEIARVPSPVDLAWRSGDDTLYVATQDGTVVPVRSGVVGAPVLDMRTRTNAGGERGLLGLAFHPTQPFAFVDYTDLEGNTVIDEYSVGADGTFDVASRRQLMTIAQPYPNHNGGEVLVGPDGMLWVFTGDGGASGDPQRRALDLSSLLGKILRIDPSPVDGAAYGIPADNPFVDVSGARPEIWAVGMRNPWRASFDRVTGDLWIADVGQNRWEEIDVAWAAEGTGRGANFGWSAWEGTHRYNDDQPADQVTMPIHEYEHGNLGCSISGGVRYRGPAIPALEGWYVYSDYCSGQVRALQIDGRTAAAEVTLGSSSQVSAVREGPDGELYVLSLTGVVLRIAAA